jgi:membrane protein implicated in regulation of membrane protease activity
MAVVLVAVVVVALALMVLKVVSLPLGIVLLIVGVFAVVAAGERRDRSRQRGLGDVSSRLDVNRGVVPMSTEPQADADDAVRTQIDGNIWTQPPPSEKS